VDKRIPIAVFVILFIVAVTWRILNPRPPTPPGPNGDQSSWRSSLKVGDMSAQAVNPAGTCWAGGWFVKSEKPAPQKYRSSLRIVPFDSSPAKLLEFGPPRLPGYIAGIGWMDDSTIWVLLNDTESSMPMTSSVVIVDAATAAIKSETKLSAPVYRVFGCVRKAGQLACMATGAEGAHLTLVSTGGRLDTRVQALPFKEGDSVGQIFGASPNGKFLVVSIDTDLPEGRVPVYYLLTAETGASRPVFNALQLPSRAETVCVSDSGEVLVVCRVADKPDVLSISPQLPGLPKLATKVTDVRKRWPDCPKELLFVSYKYIYSYDPATTKKAVLVELKNDTSDREYMVQQVQGGSAYRQGTDRFVTVSVVGESVDIRVFTKTGTVDRDILPRQ
jgi:hypothetical protein